MVEIFQYTFEWDPKKAVSNRRKHGIGFEQETLVFSDPLALSIYDEEHSETEERWITLGKTVGGVLVVVHSYREIHDNEILIHIISARTATNHEQQQYEAQ